MRSTFDRCFKELRDGCIPATLRLTERLSTVAKDEVLANAVIAVGANIGNRLENIREALQQIRRQDIEVVRHSRLYESAAAYVTAQPAFLNAAIAIKTKLEPLELLKALKAVEERDFVKAPVADLYSKPELAALDVALANSLLRVHEQWDAAGGEAQLGSSSLRCVLPLGPGRALWPWQARTMVMGILNVTPDSFSSADLTGTSPHVAAAAGVQLAALGADLLDVGGQSTRPGASPVSPREELARVLPVIRQLREEPSLAAVPISVDTFSSEVARHAVAAGAGIVNDVSGGTLDPAMHATVAELGVSYVAMHMRGSPASMQQASNTAYPVGQLAAQVGRELRSRCQAAVAAGIEPWRIILDPGIGFAKTREGNCQLIRGLQSLKEQLPGKSEASERDMASAVAAGLCIREGASIIRMHNVEAGREAAAVADGILKTKAH